MSGFGTKSQKGDKDKKPVVESVVSDFEEPVVPVTAPVAETAPPVIQEKSCGTANRYSRSTKSNHPTTSGTDAQSGENPHD